MRITTGRGGYKNICRLSRKDQSGSSQEEDVEIGDLVLIAKDNVLRNRWPMGRVMELFCGEDGGVQYVKIKTAGNVFHRPVTKLGLLEEAS